MGRLRKRLEKKFQSGCYWVVFRHPLFENKVTRLKLGFDSVRAEELLRDLNFVFLDPGRWHDADGIGADARLLWLGKEAESDVGDERGESSALSAKETLYQTLYRHERARRIRHEKTLVFIHKQKIREGPSPTLGASLSVWLKSYVGRDKQHTINVRGELTRFVKHFGAARLVDTFVGNELEIKNYLAGLGVGPGRRNQIRGMILRLLDDSGALLDRTKIRAAGRREIRSKRGAIRFLERSQASALAEKLLPYWADVFRVQVGIGLRPEELPTLQADNFSPGLERLTLTSVEFKEDEDRDDLTLKTGPRTINLPANVRAIVKRRLQSGAFVFPQIAYTRSGKTPEGEAPLIGAARAVETQEPWRRLHWFNRKYRRELNAALEKVNSDPDLQSTAKIAVRLDARIGRRTCATLLLRDGVSVEFVARMLGDDPDTIREHYGFLCAQDVRIRATEI